MSDADRIARVGAKLDRLRPGGMSLGAPLSLAEQAYFERTLGIALPSALALFLVHLGNGGVGPGNGLETIANDARRPREKGTLAERLAADPHAPARPFPLARPQMPEDADSEGWNDGSLFVADYGCAIEARLVLNGPFRGHVWMIDGSNGAFVPFGTMAGIHSCGPSAEEHTDATFDFVAWYEHWLDTSLRER